MSGFHEEEALGKVYDANLARRLFHYLRPYKWQVIFAVALTLAVSPLEAVGPYLFHIAVDRYLVPVSRHLLPFAGGMRGLEWVSAAYLGALLLSFLVLYIQVRVMQRVGQKTMYDLRREIFEHLQRLPMSFYDRSPVGRLVTRVTTDVDALNDLFAAGVVAMLNDAFLLVFFAAIMLKMNWRLALATLSVLPVMTLVTWIFRNKVRGANRRIRVAIARINAFLQEHISGMAVVQLFNREQKARWQFEKLNRTHMEAYKDAILAFALFYPTVEFLSTTAIALVLWYGGLQVIVGAVEIGLLIAYIQYAQRFFRPIQDLSEKFNILQTAMAASERIFKLLDEPVMIGAAAPAVRGISIPASETPASLQVRMPIPGFRGEIEFRNVWFRYRDEAASAPAGAFTSKDFVTPASSAMDHASDTDNWVLRDVSFRVEPGRTAALVGHTGAGKTTIIQLLLRFYEIQRGQILLDGIDIREFDLSELRRHFGIVLQDPFLFSGTLESNVRLGSEWIDRAAVERALVEVGLGPFLQSLPDGIATPVTERGITFSVGQRQLISFARALAHSPQILILDEATSSVDTQTEMLIREALDRLLTNRTAMVIAHRLSTIQRADRILVMHKGRLREQGNHQQLLAQRGIYYKLYQLQYKEQELRLPVPWTASAPIPLPADD